MAVEPPESFADDTGVFGARFALSQTLTGHVGFVAAVAFSPDNTTLASAGAEEAVRLWDPRTGQVLCEPLVGGAGGIGALVFSPDGTVLASADVVVRLSYPRTGLAMCEPLTGHTGWVNALAFSPDGAMLASLGSDGDETVRLWSRGLPTRNAHAGRTVARYRRPSPSMNLPALVAGSSDTQPGTLRVAIPSVQMLIGRSGWIKTLAFSPDGVILASAGRDKMVRMWNPHTGQALGEPLTARRHASEVYAVAFSPDGTVLASAGSEGTVRLWNARTGRGLRKPLTGHSGTVHALAFSPDGTVLASTGSDGTVRLMGPAHRPGPARSANRPRWHRHVGVFSRRLNAGLYRQRRDGAAMGPAHWPSTARSASRPHKQRRIGVFPGRRDPGQQRPGRGDPALERRSFRARGRS